MAADKEMLEAIGQLIDAKLGPFKAEVLERLDKLEGDVGGMKQDIGALSEDVGGMKQDIGVLRKDTSEIKEDGAIPREATNKILAWAEEASVMVQIPLFKKN